MEWKEQATVGSPPLPLLQTQRIRMESFQALGFALGLLSRHAIAQPPSEVSCRSQWRIDRQLRPALLHRCFRRNIHTKERYSELRKCPPRFPLPQSSSRPDNREILSATGNPTFHPDDRSDILEALERARQLSAWGQGEKNYAYALENMNIRKIGKEYAQTYKDVING